MFGGVAILSMESGRKVELDLIKLGRIEEKERKKEEKKFKMWDRKQEKMVPRKAVHMGVRAGYVQKGG